MSSQRSNLRDNYKYCTACGHSNPPWSKTCGKCRARLEDLPELSVSGSRERPGCVTAYVVLIIIGVVLSILAAIVLVFSSTMMNQYMDKILSNPELNSGLPGQAFDSALLAQIMSIVLPVTLVITSITVVFNLLVAWGLWRLKNWARIVVIVVQGLGLLGNLYSMVMAFLSPSSADSEIMMVSTYGTVCVMLISLAIGGYIVYWFVANGKYFS